MSEASTEYVCPYYQWSRGLRLGCEGECRVSFPDRQAKEDYVARYCANLPGWGRCSLARAKNQFYERD